MIDWKQKLSSRKFWAALVSYTTGMLAAWGVSDNTALRITSVLTGIGALIVYILAESYIDAKRLDNDTKEE